MVGSLRTYVVVIGLAALGLQASACGRVDLGQEIAARPAPAAMTMTTKPAPVRAVGARSRVAGAIALVPVVVATEPSPIVRPVAPKRAHEAQRRDTGPIAGASPVVIVLPERSDLRRSTLEPT